LMPAAAALSRTLSLSGLTSPTNREGFLYLACLAESSLHLTALSSFPSTLLSSRTPTAADAG
jgi:hypothetical protein